MKVAAHVTVEGNLLNTNEFKRKCLNSGADGTGFL